LVGVRDVVPSQDISLWRGAALGKFEDAFLE